MRPTLSEDSVRLVEGRQAPVEPQAKPVGSPAPPNLEEALARASKNLRKHRAKK